MLLTIFTLHRETTPIIYYSDITVKEMTLPVVYVQLWPAVSYKNNLAVITIDEIMYKASYGFLSRSSVNPVL